MKEILNKEYDEEFGTTELKIRIPGFNNFGSQLEAIENAAYGPIVGDGEEEDLAELEKAADDAMKRLASSSGEMTEAALESIQNTPGLNDEDRREAIRQIKETQALLAGEISVDELDEEEEDEEEEEEECQPPDVLQVLTEEGIPWGVAQEAQVDALLSAWPTLRPKVLEAVWEKYQVIRPSYIDENSTEAARIQMPVAPASDVVDGLFRIGSVHLREDGRLGLGGSCTWDEEHAVGILLDANLSVLDVGGESCAFEQFD